MTRRSLLTTLTASAAAPSRPNILFLFADDMRADLIHAHGNPHIRTPHLDRLVRQSTSFRHNYVCGGNSGAVCVPSRAMLMTGKSWFQINTETLKGETLFPELLARHGYTTHGTGKWHNGQASFAQAFQQGHNVFFGGMCDHTKVPVRDMPSPGNFTPQQTGAKFSSELFADATIDFLRTQQGKGPFFSYTAFTAPHDPRQPLSPYREQYEKRLPPLPLNYQPQLGFDNGMMRNIRDENLAAWPRTEGVIRSQLAEYYALMSHLDAQIGRILQTLAETGQARNTIIVFAADNGLALGSHGLLGKQNVYEHSMRTPLLISGPGLPRNRQTRAFTYLFDLAPTLLDLAGLDVPAGFEGKSLRPLLTGRQTAIRDTVFLPFLDIQRAIRDERYKLIGYPKIGHLQLFDLQADPHETRNLIDDPALQPRVAQLRQRLAEWQTRLGDKVAMPLANTAPAKVDLSGQPRQPDQWQPQWIIDKYFGPARP